MKLNNECFDFFRKFGMILREYGKLYDFKVGF